MAEGVLAALMSGRTASIDAFMTIAPFKCHSIDRHGKLLNVSNAWAAALRYEPSEMIGRPSVDFLTPESRREALEIHLPAFFDRGSMFDVPYTFETSDGNPYHVLMSATLIAENGAAPRSFAVIVDNKAALELAQLRAQLADYRQIIADQAPQALPDFERRFPTV